MIDSGMSWIVGSPMVSAAALISSSAVPSDTPAGKGESGQKNRERIATGFLRRRGTGTTRPIRDPIKPEVIEAFDLNVSSAADVLKCAGLLSQAFCTAK